MTAFARLLTTWPAIAISLLLMIVIGMSFGPVQDVIDGPLLDMILLGDAAKARLAEMSAVQKTAHFWGTVINDTAYPLAYGAFFAGVAGRFAPERLRLWAMFPAAITIVADLAENIVQALALTRQEDLLALKTVLSPLKFGFFLLSALLALGLAIAALVRAIRRRPRPQP